MSFFTAKWIHHSKWLRLKWKKNAYEKSISRWFRRRKKNGFRYWQMSPCENIHSVWIKEKRKKISAWPLLARDGTAYGVYLCAIAIEHVWTMLRPSNCWEFNCPMNRCSINSLFAVFHLNKKESTHFGEYTSRMHSHERWTHLKYACFFHIWTVNVFFLYCIVV